ncbi:MAG: hypothetical protein JXA77_00265 [Bacteroidales bacterium]|nr:hypothetical protein [Bacteroidales bacterium]MBN2821226.1 hypothetical protein [Bacteroidales bacterium]
MKATKNILTKSIIILALGVFSSYILTKNIVLPNAWYLFMVPLSAFLINILAFTACTSTRIARNFSTMISALLGIKFFSYIILAMIYLVLTKETQPRLIFILYLFLIYVANTLVLLSEILKFLKTISNKK